MDDQNINKKIFSFPRGADEEIQMSLRFYNGRTFADIRIWYKDKQDNCLRPTKKGVFFPLDLLPEFVEGIRRLKTDSERMENGFKTPVSAQK